MIYILLLQILPAYVYAYSPIHKTYFGNKDPGKCDTVATAYEYTSYNYMSYIGGNTKSKTIVLGDNIASCFDRPVALVVIFKRAAEFDDFSFQEYKTFEGGLQNGDGSYTDVGALKVARSTESAEDKFNTKFVFIFLEYTAKSGSKDLSKNLLVAWDPSSKQQKIYLFGQKIPHQSQITATVLGSASFSNSFLTEHYLSYIYPGDAFKVHYVQWSPMTGFMHYGASSNSFQTIFGATSIVESGTNYYIGGNVVNPSSPSNFIPAVVKASNPRALFTTPNDAIKSEWGFKIQGIPLSGDAAHYSVDNIYYNWNNDRKIIGFSKPRRSDGLEIRSDHFLMFIIWSGAKISQQAEVIKVSHQSTPVERRILWYNTAQYRHAYAVLENRWNSDKNTMDGQNVYIYNMDGSNFNRDSTELGSILTWERQLLTGSDQKGGSTATKNVATEYTSQAQNFLSQTGLTCYKDTASYGSCKLVAMYPQIQSTDNQPFKRVHYVATSTKEFVSPSSWTKGDCTNKYIAESITGGTTRFINGDASQSGKAIILVHDDTHWHCEESFNINGFGVQSGQTYTDLPAFNPVTDSTSPQCNQDKFKTETAQSAAYRIDALAVPVYESDPVKRFLPQYTVTPKCTQTDCNKCPIIIQNYFSKWTSGAMTNDEADIPLLAYYDTSTSSYTLRLPKKTLSSSVYVDTSSPWSSYKLYQVMQWDWQQVESASGHVKQWDSQIYTPHYNYYFKEACGTSCLNGDYLIKDAVYRSQTDKCYIAQTDQVPKAMNDFTWMRIISCRAVTSCPSTPQYFKAKSGVDNFKWSFMKKDLPQDKTTLVTDMVEFTPSSLNVGLDDIYFWYTSTNNWQQSITANQLKQVVDPSTSKLTIGSLDAQKDEKTRLVFKAKTRIECFYNTEQRYFTEFVFVNGEVTVNDCTGQEVKGISPEDPQELWFNKNEGRKLMGDETSFFEIKDASSKTCPVTKYEIQDKSAVKVTSSSAPSIYNALELNLRSDESKLSLTIDTTVPAGTKYKEIEFKVKATTDFYPQATRNIKVHVGCYDYRISDVVFKEDKVNSPYTLEPKPASSGSPGGGDSGPPRGEGGGEGEGEGGFENGKTLFDVVVPPNQKSGSVADTIVVDLDKILEFKTNLADCPPAAIFLCDKADRTCRSFSSGKVEAGKMSMNSLEFDKVTHEHGPKMLTFKTDSPIVEEQQIGLKAHVRAPSSTYFKIRHVVCGLETLTASTPETKYDEKPSSKTATLDLSKIFSYTLGKDQRETECPITDYKICKDVDCKDDKVNSALYKLDTKKLEVTVSFQKEVDETVYLYAITKGLIKATSKLSVKVKAPPPPPSSAPSGDKVAQAAPQPGVRPEPTKIDTVPMFADGLGDVQSIKLVYGADRSVLRIKSNQAADLEGFIEYKKNFQFGGNQPSFVTYDVQDKYFEVVIDQSKITRSDIGTKYLTVTLGEGLVTSTYMFSITVEDKPKPLPPPPAPIVVEEKVVEPEIETGPISIDGNATAPVKEDVIETQKEISCDYSDSNCLKEEKTKIQTSTFPGVIIDDKIREENSAKIEFLERLIKEKPQKDDKAAKTVDEDQYKLASWIQDISPLGMVTVKFNGTLDQKLLPKIEEIDDRVIGLTIIPGIFSEDIVTSRYEFTWKLESIDFIKSEFYIQTYFENPLQVSVGDAKDKFKVKFKKPWLFREARSDFQRRRLQESSVVNYIGKDFLQIDASIGRQMPVDDESQNFQTGIMILQGIIQFSILFLFVTQTMFNDGYKHLLLTIFAFQHIIFHGLLHLQFPGNVVMFHRQMRPTVSFDFFQSIKNWFISFSNYDIVGQKIAREDHMIGALKEFNYPYTNSFLVLGLLGVLILSYVAFAAIIAPLTTYLGQLTRSQKLSQRLNKKVYFKSLINISIYGFLPMILAVKIALECQVHTTPIESLSVVFAYLILCMNLIIVPIIVVIVATCNPENYKEDSFFKRRFDVLFKDIRTHDYYQRSFYVGILIKRFLLLFVAHFMSEHPGNQVQVILMLSVLSLIHEASSRALISRFDRTINILNEVFIICAVCYMLLFTNWVDQTETQLSVGWRYIYISITQLTINYFFVIRSMKNRLRLYLFRYLTAYGYQTPNNQVMQQIDLCPEYKVLEKNNKHHDGFYNASNYRRPQVVISVIPNGETPRRDKKPVIVSLFKHPKNKKPKAKPPPAKLDIIEEQPEFDIVRELPFLIEDSDDSFSGKTKKMDGEFENTAPAIEKSSILQELSKIENMVSQI